MSIRISACAWIALASIAACNAITGVGKYEITDCPSGQCADGSGLGDASTDVLVAADSQDLDADVESPLPTCTGGRAPVRLTVTGSDGSVSSDPSGLSVRTGETESACFASGRIDLRTNGPSATWTGVTCRDGSNVGDRCEFELSSDRGADVVATMH